MTSRRFNSKLEDKKVAVGEPKIAQVIKPIKKSTVINISTLLDLDKERSKLFIPMHLNP